MDKLNFICPVVEIVLIDHDNLICCSGPEPVDKIVKSDSAFGFDASERI